MSWDDVVIARGVSRRESPYETSRFGRSFSRLTVPLGSQTDDVFDDVREALARDAADVVVLRYPASRVDWFARLLGPERDLIAADSLVYWRLQIGSGRRPAAAADLSASAASGVTPEFLDSLVRDMFVGYGNHYLANPLLDPAAALDGYVEWARRSADQDTSVVLTQATEGAVGLATMSTSGSVSEIELAGIAAQAQQRGYYGHLLAGCEDVAGAAGADRLVISTQVHNTDVQRAWARYGFEPVGTVLTVHAVRTGLLP